MLRGYISARLDPRIAWHHKRVSTLIIWIRLEKSHVRGDYSNISGINIEPGHFSREGSTTKSRVQKVTISQISVKMDVYRPILAISRSTGGKEQTACPSGYFQPLEGGVECLLSPLNTYSSAGSTDPIECPNGWTSPQGSYYWSDCFIDSDFDGISDYDDNYPNLHKNSIMLSFGFKLLITCLFLGFVNREQFNGVI